MRRSKISTDTFSFTLRGINQQQMIQNYISGKHLTMSVVKNASKKKHMTSSNSMIRKPGTELDEDPFKQSFVINANSTKQVIRTTNHDIFEAVMKNGGELVVMQFRCFYCRHEFTRIPCGIPLIVEFVVDKYRFHCDEMYYCDLNCVYAQYIDFMRHIDEYKNVEENLKLLFSLMHPGKVLTRAKDFRLHKDNHGPLDEHEYRVSSYQYVKIPSLIIYPLKRQYIEFK